MIIKNIWYFIFILLEEKTKRTVFHVQVYDLDETTLLQDTINFTNPYIYISNLTSTKTYFLKIWTTNLFGKSEEINLTVTTKNSNDSSMNFLLKNTRIFIFTLFLTIIIFSILVFTLISIYVIQKIRSILVSRKRRRKIREKSEDKLMENLLRDLNNEKHVFNSCKENSNIQYFSNENKFLVIKFCSDDESNASISYRSNSTIETTVSYEKKFLNSVFIYLNMSVKFELSFFLLCLGNEWKSNFRLERKTLFNSSLMWNSSFYWFFHVLKAKKLYIFMFDIIFNLISKNQLFGIALNMIKVLFNFKL
jgi:hypothetical protein